MPKNKLLLVDGNSVAFRAFFALHNSLERFKNANGRTQMPSMRFILCLKM